MEFDLHRGLHDLSGAPPIAPDAVPTIAVLARVHRGRTLRAAGVSLASAAAVLAFGAVVYASPWQTPAPAETPTPTSTTPAPTPTPTRDPSPEPTSTPTETRAPVTVPSPIALTAAGDLVELDPVTGATTRTVATDPIWTSGLSVTPDRRYAYVTAWNGSYDSGAVIQRVSLADGAVETVTPGYDAAVSPDGTRLAYLAESGTAPWESRSLFVMDIGTGEILAEVPDGGCSQCGWYVANPAWSPDGARVIVTEGETDSPGPSSVLVSVDPFTAPTVVEGTLVGAPSADAGEGYGAAWRNAAPAEEEGTILAGETSGPLDAWEIATGFSEGTPSGPLTAAVVRIDMSTGVVLERMPIPGVYVVDVAGRPGGEGFLVLVRDGETRTLYSWSDGHVAALAEGITAVAW